MLCPNSCCSFRGAVDLHYSLDLQLGGTLYLWAKETILQLSAGVRFETIMLAMIGSCFHWFVSKSLKDGSPLHWYRCVSWKCVPLNAKYTITTSNEPATNPNSKLSRIRCRTITYAKNIQGHITVRVTIEDFHVSMVAKSTTLTEYQVDLVEHRNGRNNCSPTQPPQQMVEYAVRGCCRIQK